MSATADVLFGKTRQAVLSRLFESSSSAYYLRELARQTGISPGALQHELARLVAADLVEREDDGNRVRYRANVKHPIFAEMQSIVHKTCGLPTQLRAALQSVEGIRFAAIYGSFAKRQEHARSDVDLLVVGSQKLETVLSAIEPLESSLNREISVRNYSTRDFRTRREEGDAFLSATLDGPLISLVGSPNDT
jgi:predicted nucleotidyltransferase